MVKTENITRQGKELVYTYSDMGYMLQDTADGALYVEAYNPIESGREYIEVINEEEATEAVYIGMLRALGVEI